LIDSLISRDRGGPMCRTVEDTATMLEVLDIAFATGFMRHFLEPKHPRPRAVITTNVPTPTTHAVCPALVRCGRHGMPRSLARHDPEAS
jgi:hypothetical protein